MLYELLLVDDEEASRNGLATYFPWEEQGFHVCGQVSDGQEALEWIRKQKVHVVLTDISMPGMDGIELARQIQKEEDHPCVVFLSAYDDFQYAQKAIRYGVRFYILKPSGFEELKETFQEIKKELDGRFEEISLVEKLHNEDEIVSQVMEYISGEYRTGTLTEISERLFLSPSYLSQLVKLKTGKNFVDLLFDMRMSKACAFLKDPEVKIYHISEMVGYTNPNNFTRAFKARYGHSPKEYQMLYREKQKRGGIS